MKTTGRLLLILLILSLAAGLFACGGGDKCKEHADGDGDGKCDNCGETVEKEEARVLLFDDGIPNFQFVLATGLSRRARELIKDYAEALSDLNIDITVADDKADGEIECEILIGSVTSRGDKYIYDTHELGNDGYIFKIIDKKIIVNAGSPDALEAAIEEFIYDVLMFDEDAEEIGTIYMAEAQEVLEKQEYDITSIKVNGNDIKDYTIAAGTDAASAAKALAEALYDRAGYWLEIVALDKADKSIVLNPIDTAYGTDSFKVYVNTKSQLVIDYAFANKLGDAVESFISKKITLAKGDVEFTGTDVIYSHDISFLTYEKFGAAGDGVTDDFNALYKTHDEANKTKQTVKAKNGAKYYIEHNKVIINGTTKVTAIPIRTNTEWTGAEIIIDDSDIDYFDPIEKPMATTNIFEILPDTDKVRITDRAKLDALSINRGTAKIDLGLGYPAMIVPYNDTEKIYRRLGYGQFTGSSMHEIIVIDENGNIDLTSDSSTPVMFDYSEISYIEVYRIDTDHITLTGGTVTHIGQGLDARIESADSGGKVTVKTAGYMARGLNVKRAFTVVDGLVHNIVDEFTPAQHRDQGLESSPYNGFFYAQNTTNVTFKDCTMTGRRNYGTGGTYEFGASCVNKVVLDGCIQQNFWVVYDEANGIITPATRETEGAVPSMSSISINDKSYGMFWGIGGTNYCKNMEYIDSVVSRFDAHSGLYNGKIIRTTVSGLEITGYGDLILEDVEYYSYGTGGAAGSLFYLRNDYGSTWTGTLYAKNIKAYINPNATLLLMYHQYRNWYWGYRAHVPNLVLDNLKLYNNKTLSQMPAGTAVKLISDSMISEPAMHLSTTKNTSAIYPYVDYDKDGKVDNTNENYSQSLVNEKWGGVSVSGDMNNQAITVPPEYIKIINNSGRYLFTVQNTFGAAATADPDVTLPAGVSPDGGFFGMTKFIYGTGENDYYIGTDHSSTQTFLFR